MRVVFIGTVKFSAYALKELIDMQVQVVGLCTMGESKFNSDYVDISPIAHNAGIPVRKDSNINCADSVRWIRGCSPDVIFCFGWSQLLKDELLAIPKLGVIGFHPAALPKNRGRHPIVWALILGLSETASTFFFMDSHADSGDILSQTFLQIDPDENADSLYKKIVKAAVVQIREFVPKLANGTYTRTPQNHALANYWRKRSVADGRIDWRMSAESIHALVRGLSPPYIGAEFIKNDRVVKVWQSEIVKLELRNIEPGRVIGVDANGILVKTGDYCVRLLKYSNEIIFSVGDCI